MKLKKGFSTISLNLPRMDLTEQAKQKASYLCVEEQLGDAQLVGVGSGSTVVYAVKKLGELHKQRPLKACIPSSFQAQQLILENGLPLGTLNEYPALDVAFDGADEVDPSLNCIKGGGGCLLQELVISNAKRWYIIADYRKESPILGSIWKKGVPIEVVPLVYNAITKKLEEMGGKVKLRMAVAKAGPCVTDNGNFILDTDFGEIKDPKELDFRLRTIPGIVETGIFHGLANGVYYGKEDGGVKKLLKK